MNQSAPLPLAVSTPAPRIAFIQARWHAEVVDRCREGFLAELKARGEDRLKVEVFDVPGAFEIPLQARMLARNEPYAAIVAAAFVVDGGIYRHEFVAGTVLDALMQVQMETDVPVLSVLTPHHYQDTDAHLQFFRDHFLLKGREVADACHSLLALRGVLPAAAAQSATS